MGRLLLISCEELVMLAVVTVMINELLMLDTT
jgi:hypothetical protein